MVNAIETDILAVFRRSDPLPIQEYLALLERVNTTLENEPEEYRPHDSLGLPGGLVLLDPDIETVLVPDIHARMDLLVSVLLGEELSGLRRMADGELQIVCVGDGFHGEARVLRRWISAYEEFSSGFRKHASMDREMFESLGVMEMVMLLKNHFPRSFHYLKGNHDNIKNEHGHGNYPFLKFVNEGAMVASYVQMFLGSDFHDAFYRFEKNLPLLTQGGRFLVSHAEPARFFSRTEVTEYRQRGDVVEGLTWTDNDQAQPGSVKQMLDSYLDGDRRIGARYFGGHRPVSGLFGTRAEGLYIQFHNPDRLIAARLSPDEPADPSRNVLEIGNVTDRFE